MSDSYIYRRLDTQEEEGDFPGFLTFIFLQYVHYQDVPPVSIDDQPPPPLQWGAPAPLPFISGMQGQHDHEAGPSRRQVTDLPPGFGRQLGVCQTPDPEHDPEGRGKAPLIATPDDDEDLMGNEVGDEAVLQGRSPEEHRQPPEVHGPLHIPPLARDFYADMRRRSAEMLARLDAIRAEMDLEDAMFPIDEIPPPAPEALPGAVEDDPVAVDSDSDYDDDFEGSSGLSSLDSDGDW